jgi:predicted TIM-barrel fold metal-dependent hydrolase
VVRNGYRIIDTDTHVGPCVEVLEKFAGPALRARWDELLPYYQPLTDGGHQLSINPIPYKRPMGQHLAAEAGVRGGVSPLKGSVSATLKVPVAKDVNNENPQGRLADMDREGVDTHLLIPATFSTAVSALDPDLGKEIHGAYNRFIEWYCSADPERLKATVLVHGADPTWSAGELRRLSEARWVAAATVVLPEGLPIDDPDLEPIWQALDEADLPILHHSFFYEPPYFPGYRDVWGNVVVARAASHPWGAQRLVGYLALSGMFDRYPNLRIGFSECSAGWLPGWLVRLDGQADYMSHAVPERKNTALGYAREGRIFCGIELYEGLAIAEAIIRVCGDGVLMYQSDYPHPGCDFPNSPDVVLAWTSLGAEAMRKILAGNAERYLRLI